MPQWGFSLGSAGTGYVNVTENWNSSSQVSLNVRVFLTKSGGWYNGTSGPNWNANIGGVAGSGNFTYSAGTHEITFWHFNHTYNKDANGNINIGVYGYINGDNAPGVGAGSTSQNYSPARIGQAPGGRASSVDTITVTSARLGAKHDNNGRGTSSANRSYWRLNNAGGWSQTADNGGTGWKYRTVTTLASNSMYGRFSRHWNNNGDTADTGVATFATLPAAATAGVITFLATTASIPTTQATGGGFHAITKQYRLKQGADAWGAWTTFAPTTIELSGLLPNTDYQLELRSTTSAGTTTNATTYNFTTLPAGKLVYSDGSVVNAIPRVVVDSEPTVMVNINIIEPL